jgi:hypothetical protein
MKTTGSLAGAGRFCIKKCPLTMELNSCTEVLNPARAINLTYVSTMLATMELYKDIDLEY